MRRAPALPFVHEPSGLRIVASEPAHFAAMQAIEAVSFPTTWSKDSFEKETSSNQVATYLTGLLNDQVVGYVGSWIVIDEVHITTIAVDPACRGQQVGRRILARLLLLAVEQGARWTVLEVRESNLAAIRMYESFGFRKVGVRKKYYENDENALVLWVGAMQSLEFRTCLCKVLDLELEALPPAAAEHDADPSAD
jgi:[ribosomal protein S18]-alanine N-acetyltransferase